MHMQVPNQTPIETESNQNEIMIVENNSMVLLGSSNHNGSSTQLKSSGGNINPLKVSDSISANNSSMNAYQLNFGGAAAGASTSNTGGINQQIQQSQWQNASSTAGQNQGAGL